MPDVLRNRPSDKVLMRTVSFAIASVLFGAFCACGFAAAKIEEKNVGPAWELGTIYTLSPRGMHLATASAKGSRFVVEVDGVEGEKFDQILNAAAAVDVQYYDTGYIMAQRLKWQGPVAFSPDGARHAYAARNGKDVMVILDGKEIYRAPYSMSVAAATLLFFTPDGKHLMFYRQTSDSMQSFQLMVDGKPATPPFDQTPYPVFSADGSRWALVGSSPRQPAESFLVIDGKVASYAGHRPQFTADGKRLVTTTGQQGNQSLLVDGKPLVTASLIERYAISPNGEIGTIAVSADGKKQLYLNGRPAPNGEDAWSVVFSPDGAHWGAICVAPPSSWVVVDGKKHQAYSSVRDVRFSPDSSTHIYIAEAGVKKFVVINGVEDNGNGYIHSNPIFGQTGPHVAYAVGETTGAGTRKAVYDGKIQPVSYNVFNVTLSPDGKRFAYFGAVDALGTRLIVDGKPEGTGGGFGGEVMFSPDSKHVVAIASPPKGYPSIYFNGEFIPFPKDLGYGQLLEFTPDSAHLLIKGTEGGLETYYIDGVRAAQFSPRGVTWMNSQKPKSWEIQPDGSVVFIGVTPAENNGYGPMKRVTVRPEAGTSVGTWAKAVATAREQALADAAAAKEKAIQDAAEAKAKAEAERLAAIEARAKARAEADAAKAKLRAEANAAKAKARADAAEAKANKAK